MYPMLSLPCGEPLASFCSFCRSSWKRSSTTLSCLPNLCWTWDGLRGLGRDLWESERPNRELTGLLRSGDLDLLMWEEEPFFSPSSLTLWTESTPFAKISLSLPLTMINFSSTLILHPISFSIFWITFSVKSAFTCFSLAGTLSKKSWDLRLAPRVDGHPYTYKTKYVYTSLGNFYQSTIRKAKPKGQKRTENFLKSIVHGKNNKSKMPEGLRHVQKDKEPLVWSTKKMFGISTSDSRTTQCAKFGSIHSQNIKPTEWETFSWQDVDCRNRWILSFMLYNPETNYYR